MTHSFIDRPIFATVLSVFVTLIGLGALAILPIAQYPEIVPPTVQITTSYPGASADVVSRTVATPLEDQFTAIPDLAQMSSTSGLGQTTITLQFNLDRNIDGAAQDVQTAINAAGG